SVGRSRNARRWSLSARTESASPRCRRGDARRTLRMGRASGTIRGVNFGFLPDQDTTRFCYLRLRRLKQAIKDPKVLEALVEELEVPGKGMAAIERRIEDLRGTKTSMWYGVPAPEVLA